MPRWQVNDKFMTIFLPINTELQRIFIRLCLLYCLLFISCGNEKPTYNGFYYPWIEEKDSVIYVYDERRLSLGKQYHLMKKMKTDSGTYVQKTVYNQALTPTLKTIEKQLSNGFVLTDYILFQAGREQLDTIEARIVEGQTFYYHMDSVQDVLVENLHLDLSDTSHHSMIIIRNSRLKDKGTFNYKGNKYPAILMNISGEIEDIQSGSVTLSINGERKYAAEIGCVEFTQSINNKISYEYHFIGKLTPEEWKSLQDD